MGPRNNPGGRTSREMETDNGGYSVKEFRRARPRAAGGWERDSTGKGLFRLRSLGPVALTLVLLSLGLAYGARGQTGVGVAPPLHHLVVLHTNDTHGHPVKFPYSGAQDVGGLPARATIVKNIRAKNENVLVLDAGDLNTGRPESTFFKAKPDIEGYNYIGYDAMALGNHEFDNPVSVLKEQMAWARFPFLSANVKTKDGKYLATPYIIEQFKGFKVAVIGLTTKETEHIGNPENIKDLVFEDEVAVARKLVPEVRKQADLVIALVHLGIYDSPDRGSRRLAAEVPGIDLIVDGHSHTRLDEPVIVQSPGSLRPTAIVQAWQWGLVVGRVDLWFAGGKVSRLTFRNIPVNLKAAAKAPDSTGTYPLAGEHIPEDPVLLAALQPYVDKIDAALSEPVGWAAETFSFKRARYEETPLGDLIADSMLWYTRNLDVDFALQNGGGIRADLPAGAISRKTVYEVIPFDNSVVVLTLRGIEVQALFDFLAHIAPGSGAFPQVSAGVSFTINPAAGKCENLRVRGKPIDPRRTYRIATNSYLAAGGDGYRMLMKASDRYDSSRFQRDVLVDYVRHLGGQIRPETRQRFTILGERKAWLVWKLAA
jgi:5'-nucleotidase/UDP-sugar diphosphatase